MFDKWMTMPLSGKLCLLAVSTTLLSQCTYFGLPRNFDKHTPHYREEAKGAFVGGVTGGVARTLKSASFSPANVGWTAVVGGVIGAEIQSHPEVLIMELQNRGINAFLLGETVVIGIHGDDIFYPGSTEIRPDAEGKLQSVAALLVSYSNQPITAEGYSDDPGDVIDNVDAAEARASAVSAFLWAHGVEPERFHIVNHAGEQNVADLTSASGLADNRHIVLSTYADPPQFKLDWPLWGPK